MWNQASRLLGVIMTGGAFAVSAAVPADAGPPVFSRVSVSSAGLQSDGHSFRPAASAHGRFVAFVSSATNLGGCIGDPDENPFLNRTHVFRRDTDAGTTACVSVAGSGTPGDASSSDPAIAIDGQVIAFASSATNLVAGDTNGVSDVFVRDVTAGTTTRVSVASDGTPGNASSFRPAVSADGRFVAFLSDATNLVTPPTTLGRGHIYVHDRVTGTTMLVDVAPDGTEGDSGAIERPAISADGSVVAFVSFAANLVPGDANDKFDVFVRSLTGGTTLRVSIAGDGTEANDSSGSVVLSGDGRLVAFGSQATNLVPGGLGPGGLYVRDLVAQATTVVANGDPGAMSADGRVIVLSSLFPNVVGTSSTFYGYDRLTGILTNLQARTSCFAFSCPPGGLALIADGRLVFVGTTDALMSDDTNARGDVYAIRLSLDTAAFATGPGAGGGPHVRLLRRGAGFAHTPIADFLAYPAAFTGGVRVATGDVDGDGTVEIITGAGPGGGPHVRIWRAPAGGPVSEVTGFLAYHPLFTGGVYVATGDVDGDGTAEIITGAGPGGGPHVRVWKIAGTLVTELGGGFFPFPPDFTGGVAVASGDVDGDGRAEVVVGAGPGAAFGPVASVYEFPFGPGPSPLVTSFVAYPPAFAGGVFVGAGDVDGDGKAEVITGAGPGGGPHARVWKIASDGTVSEKAGFFAYDPAFTGGVRVAAGNADLDGFAEVLTGAGPGGGPHVRVWKLIGDGVLELPGFFPYDPAFTGGVFIGGVQP